MTPEEIAKFEPLTEIKPAWEEIGMGAVSITRVEFIRLVADWHRAKALRESIEYFLETFERDTGPNFDRYSIPRIREVDKALAAFEPKKVKN